jgi:NitT/TauT family transport system ATP-binding protein
MNGAKIQLRGATKTYDAQGQHSVPALDRVDLDVKEGEFVTIVGRSGCGKSTMLNLIAGFERTTRGSVKVDGKEITGPGPERGMVFQEYALFPWLTIEANVMFGPQSRGKSEAEARTTAKHYLDMVGLSGFERKFPHQLSGGMRQRCALARTFANNPTVMLMDEPLAALDALTRYSLQDELLRIWASASQMTSKTVLYITHSIDEAIYLADRIIVMSPRPGRIIKQIEVPFERPRNASIRTTPEFHHMADEIWTLLREENPSTTTSVKEVEHAA